MVNRFCAQFVGRCMALGIASLNASSLEFALLTSTLKDQVMSALWLDANRHFAIEEVGDFTSVYGISEGCATDSDNHFLMCSDAR